MNEELILEISIHALLAESDRRIRAGMAFPGLFLSTLSLRRATARTVPMPAVQRNFYPRSPCGERLYHLGFYQGRVEFLSTLSLRRATADCRPESQRHGRISIHALLAESDHTVLSVRARTRKFLSTLSLRRATQAQSLKIAPLSISIHALLAESDFNLHVVNAAVIAISIHALLAESDARSGGRGWMYYISIHALLAESDHLYFKSLKGI